MTAETITREEIERLRRARSDADFYSMSAPVTAEGALLGRLIAAAEAHLDEPARLAAARAEGVREGLEKAKGAAQRALIDYPSPEMNDDFIHGMGRGGSLMKRAVLNALDALNPAPAEAPTTPTVEASAPVEEGCLCRRCGTRYRVDVLIADAVWARVADGQGMLCGRCIIDAIERDGFAAYRLVEVDAFAALEAENEKLREGLRPFAKIGGEIDRYAPQLHDEDGTSVAIGDLRRARALLRGQGGADAATV